MSRLIFKYLACLVGCFGLPYRRFRAGVVVAVEPVGVAEVAVGGGVAEVVVPGVGEVAGVVVAGVAVGVAAVVAAGTCPHTGSIGALASGGTAVGGIAVEGSGIVHWNRCWGRLGICA